MTEMALLQAETPTMLEDAELAQLHDRVETLMRDAVPAVMPLDLDDADDCTRWRAHELCSYLDNRVHDPASLPDPDALSAADIDAWSQRLLLPGERITDPRRCRWYTSYWLLAAGVRVGTVALNVWDTGWDGPSLELASLYVRREHRREGHARRLLAALMQAVSASGLTSLRLETRRHPPPQLPDRSTAC